MKKFILIMVSLCILALYSQQHSLKQSIYFSILANKKAKIKPESSPNTTTSVQCPISYVYHLGTSKNLRLDSEIINTIQRLSINDDLLEQGLAASIESKHPKAFNDSWAKINTVTKLHKAGNKDGKLDYVLKISERMHLPPSVAVVPIVESNYRNRLVSNKGAAGIWQLMPQTARDYGIKLEERFQLAASTNAALHLLKDLHTKFDNWELAYAAYNAGEKRVHDAIKKNPKAITIEELDLPKETKEYVNRLKKLNQLIMKFANVRSDISRLIADF